MHREGRAGRDRWKKEQKWKEKKKGRSVSTPSMRYVCEPNGWETISLLPPPPSRPSVPFPPNLYRDRIIDPCWRDRLRPTPRVNFTVLTNCKLQNVSSLFPPRWNDDVDTAGVLPKLFRKRYIKDILCIYKCSVKTWEYHGENFIVRQTYLVKA